MDREWLKKLKAGDKVILCKSRRFDTVETVAEVEKVTPKGFVKVDGNLYSPDTGTERGGDNYLKEATEDKVKRIEQYEFVQKVFKRLEGLKKLSYKKAVELNDLLDKWEESK